MSLRQKLMAVLAVPGVVLIVATALAYQTNLRRTESTALVRRSFELRSLIDLVVADLSAAESGVRGYLLSGRDGLLHPYEGARQRLGDRLLRLEQATSGTQASQLAAILRDHAELRLRKLEELVRGGPVDPGNHTEIEEATVAGDVTMRYVLGISEELRRGETRLLAERTAALASAERVAFWIRMVGLPGGLLVAGVVVAWFAGRLVRRIETLGENTRRLQEGVPLLDSPGRRDELGHLERSLAETGARVMELQGELQRLATVDPLTGLANRRGFVDAAAHRLELAQRQGTPLALLFLDADGLKRVNDTIGHAAGDELLEEIGALLRDTFRSSDLPARLGGDEFCVLVTAETRDGISVARRRLEHAIEMSNRLPGRAYELSVSIGIAELDPVRDHAIEDLIARADVRMYEEKRAKRAATRRSTADAASSGGIAP
jgi:diguanylate cyclase (GGDEF)-like protein